ncbi:hypothetical protein TruAng_001617 [Truncatella angustata]|nr:hypothetical protein TruAng_001617 [Truncatella angustata]
MRPTQLQPVRLRSRALLIGSPVHPLVGPVNDVRIMEKLLSLYNFSVQKCLGADDGPFPATRSGITSAWQKLIEQTGPSDAVVIYYSGHGGLTEADGSEWGDQARRLQYLVPVDFGETKIGDWRGITDADIRDLLYQTTQKTKNVTIILDCCHAAHMARGLTSVKTIDPNDYRHVISHIRKMLPGMLSRHDFHHERNPHVISVVGAAISESAYEKQFPNGERMGVLTEALSETLRSCVDSGLPWRDIMCRVRDRMSRTCPEQYPDIEGPQDRLPFQERTASTKTALSAAETAPGEFFLRGGTLHGVAHGDIFAIMLFEESGGLVEQNMLAEAEVMSVGPTQSRIKLSWRNGGPHLPAGAKAFIWKKSIGVLPIHVSGRGDFAHKLRDHLRLSPLIRPSEPIDEVESIAKIEQSGNRVRIWHYRHYLLRDWEIGRDGDLSQLVCNCVLVLESLARAQHLLDLRSEPSEELSGMTLRYEIGFVENGKARPYPASDVTLPEGSRMYISVTNTGCRTLYLFLFDICADSVVLLSNGSPSGVQLLAGKTFRFGEVDTTGELRGSHVGWPPDVPKDSLIPETILIVSTDDKIDLRNLETGPWYAGPEKGRRHGSDTMLAVLVDSIAFGDRISPPETRSYKHMAYRLVPLPCQLASNSS